MPHPPGSKDFQARRFLVRAYRDIVTERMKQLRFEVLHGLNDDVVEVPFADVERLIGELAVFGSPGDMQRSRDLARALHEAISREPSAAIPITVPERVDVFVALDRIGQRSGLSDSLIALRGACADTA